MSQDMLSGLLLLGVGGGGCRLAASVAAAYGGGLRALGVDTDAMSNREASADGLTCLLLGGARLAGQGAGGDPIKGRLAAQDDFENLIPHLQGVRTVVLVACLGAGTGGGATPEIIRALHGMGVATFCVAMLPFSFESEARRKAAERVVSLLDEHADSLAVVPSDDLFEGGADRPLEEAVRAAEAALASGVTLLWRLLTRPGFIRADPERLHAQVIGGGACGFGAAAASGPERAARVVQSLGRCRLLRGGERLAKAGSVLLGILAGPDLRLAEVGAIMGAVKGLCRADCPIEMGTVLDAGYEGRVEVVALAFEGGAARASEGRGELPLIQEPPVAEAFPIQPGGRKGGRAKGGSKLAYGATGRGKFQNVEPTMIDGQDLDVPTYVRRGILLER